MEHNIQKLDAHSIYEIFNQRSLYDYNILLQAANKNQVDVLEKIFNYAKKLLTQDKFIELIFAKGTVDNQKNILHLFDQVFNENNNFSTCKEFLQLLSQTLDHKYFIKIVNSEFN